MAPVLYTGNQDPAATRVDFDEMFMMYQVHQIYMEYIMDIIACQRPQKNIYSQLDDISGERATVIRPESMHYDNAAKRVYDDDGAVCWMVLRRYANLWI